MLFLLYNTQNFCLEAKFKQFAQIFEIEPL